MHRVYNLGHRFEVFCEPKAADDIIAVANGFGIEAKVVGQKAYDEAKVATGQAISALKTLISDPIGGQFEALKNLGHSNALRAGIVLVVAFSVSCFLLGHTFASVMIQMAEMMGESGGKIAELYFSLFIKVSFFTH